MGWQERPYNLGHSGRTLTQIRELHGLYLFGVPYLVCRTSQNASKEHVTPKHVVIGNLTKDWLARVWPRCWENPIDLAIPWPWKLWSQLTLDRRVHE